MSQTMTVWPTCTEETLRVSFAAGLDVVQPTVSVVLVAVTVVRPGTCDQAQGSDTRPRAHCRH